MPRPKVGSAVIRLTRHAETPVQVDDEKLLFQIIRASFNQRRKTLANGLKNYEEMCIRDRRSNLRNPEGTAAGCKSSDLF